MRFKDLALAAVLFFLPSFVKAAPLEIISNDPKLYGVYLSGIGDTAFDVVSVNGAWNISSDWRATAAISAGFGIGIGVGIRYLFLSETYFLRPFLGVSLSLMSTRFFDSLANLFTPNYVPKPHSYFDALIPLGIDWIHPSGFNLAAGICFSKPLWDDDPNFGLAIYPGVLPFLNIGWFI